MISGVADPSMIIFFGKSVNDFATAGKFVACENDKDALIAGKSKTGLSTCLQNNRLKDRFSVSKSRQAT